MLPLAGVEATRNTGDMANLVIAAGIVALRFVAVDRLRRRGRVRLAVEDAETGSTALLRKPASSSALAEPAPLLAHAAAQFR